MSVTGNVSLLSASQLSFQLGGLTQGSQYGFINVNGTVSLGGQLVLSFVNGFQNAVSGSNSFTLMNSSSAFIGSFTNIASGDRLNTSDGAGSFLVTYNGTNLVLSNFLPGGRDYPSHLDGRQRQLEQPQQLEQQPEFPKQRGAQRWRSL